MKLPANLSIETVLAAAEADEGIGFCLACGEEVDSCEPDARNYTCESCGEPQVFGADEILVGWTV